MEDPKRELLDELLDVAGADIVYFIALFEADNRLIGLVLVLDALDDVLADHAMQRCLVKVLPAIDDLLGADGQRLHVVPDAHVAIEPVGVVLAAILGLVLDEHHALFEFKLDEILVVVEDLLEVLLGVVVELSGEGSTMMRNSSKKTP